MELGRLGPMMMWAGAGGAMRATGWRATAIRFQQFGEGIDRPDHPTSIVAPTVRTTIPLNRNGDVNQQPLRRPGGSSRSLCSARGRCGSACARFARAREGSEYGQRCPLSVLQIFRSVVDDPVPRCARPPAHHRSPELHRRPESANNNSAKTKMATSTRSRTAAQAARAGRSASELA